MNMKKMMSEARKMQSQMEKRKNEIYQKEFLVEKQGIKIVLNGNKKIKSIDLNKALIDPEDKEILEDLIIIAVNEAIENIDLELEKIHQF